MASNMAQTHLNRAKHMLTYYFKVAFEKSGLRWDYDNHSEVSDIVDEIFAAVVAELEERESQKR